MIVIDNLLENVLIILGCMHQLAGYGLRLLWALMSPKVVPAAKLLAAESRLAVYKNRIDQKKAPRPPFTRAFRFGAGAGARNLWPEQADLDSGAGRLASRVCARGGANREPRGKDRRGTPALSIVCAERTSSFRRSLPILKTTRRASSPLAIHVRRSGFSGGQGCPFIALLSSDGTTAPRSPT